MRESRLPPPRTNFFPGGVCATLTASWLIAENNAAQRAALSPSGSVSTGGGGNRLGFNFGAAWPEVLVITADAKAGALPSATAALDRRTTDRSAARLDSETLTDFIPDVLRRRSSSVRTVRAVRINAG
jgi:hypothetical protein